MKLITLVNLSFILSLLIACSSGKKDNQEEESQEMEEPLVEETQDGYSFFIGTYGTTPEDGIFAATMSGDGKISTPTLAYSIGNPSFLTLSKSGDRLYSVNESNGGLSAFSIDGDKLTLIDTANSGGNGPCYVSLNQEENVLLTANYGDGKVSAVAISGDGLDNLNSIQQEGPVGEYNRNGPHAHAIKQNPGNKLFYAPDLGADKIFIYSLDNTGLVPNQVPFASLVEGSGPRHIDFSADGKLAFVINELNSTMQSFNVNNEGGLDLIQTISTLPEGYSEVTYCADVHVHPNGKFLYGSNRGHDSIVSYSINADGTLTLIGFVQDDINWPRNFAITPDGKYLIAESQKGNIITPYAINDDGSLKKVGESVSVPAPVCIVFR